MSYRTLMFLEYGMTNAINYKCAFACDSKPKRGNTIDIVGAYQTCAVTGKPAHILDCISHHVLEEP